MEKSNSELLAEIDVKLADPSTPQEDHVGLLKHKIAIMNYQASLGEDKMNSRELIKAGLDKLRK